MISLCVCCIETKLFAAQDKQGRLLEWNGRHVRDQTIRNRLYTAHLKYRKHVKIPRLQPFTDLVMNPDFT